MSFHLLQPRQQTFFIQSQCPVNKIENYVLFGDYHLCITLLFFHSSNRLLINKKYHAHLYFCRYSSFFFFFYVIFIVIFRICPKSIVSFSLFVKIRIRLNQLRHQRVVVLRWNVYVIPALLDHA